MKGKLAIKPSLSRQFSDLPCSGPQPNKAIATRPKGFPELNYPLDKGLRNSLLAEKGKRYSESIQIGNLIGGGALKPPTDGALGERALPFKSPEAGALRVRH